MVTLRVKGTANLDDNMQIKDRIIANNGLVRSIYGSADNPDFTVFSVDYGTATCLILLATNLNRLAF